MFGLMFSLLGLGVAGAAVAGAGSDDRDNEAPDTRQTEMLVPPDDSADVDNIFVDDTGTDVIPPTGRVEDAVVDTPAKDALVDTPVKDVPEEPCPETGDADDSGSAGPCPKTGDAVCHCDDDKDKDTDHDHSGHDHGGHDDHAGHGTGIPAPETPAEIEAFVAAVRSSPETHSHGHDHVSSAMATEHMAALDLVARADATHIAIGSGDWDDPNNWYKGMVPADGARALIPEGIHMTYSGVHDDRLLTLRVDGHLDFDEGADSRLIVDTFVVSPSGTLTIGTEENPIQQDANVEIFFANNGGIDTDWDPLLLSRGMVAYGSVEIHGAEKDSHEKVITDPMAGDTWIDFADLPAGWEIGDTIIVAGTDYRGHDPNLPGGYQPPEDEERVITSIEGGRVHLDKALEFDHDTPRDDLKTSVANYTRNITFETEDAATAEVYERGHIMFMHNDDVDVRYAAFNELGRTDKSETALNPSQFSPLDFDSNVKGRYSFHFHRAGVDGEDDDPGIAIGNAIYGSPGWGFVHHDSHAVFENNATYDTFGAGYVAESGNETGSWHDNIAIFAEGVSWNTPKLGNDTGNFDLAKTGDGFWLQSRMITTTENIAASVNHGFVFYHRGPGGEHDGSLRFDSEITAIEDAFYFWDDVKPDQHPILGFYGNESFASKSGIWVVKAESSQGHDVHTVLEDFTAWNVAKGADFEYTSQYVLIDFDIVGREATDQTDGGVVGVSFGNNTTDMTIVDAKIDNFETGINFWKVYTGPEISAGESHGYTVVNPTFSDIDTLYDNYDPAIDRIIGTDDLGNLTPDIAFDSPLVYKEGDGNLDYTLGKVIIDGTKSDTLGETSFPGSADNYTLSRVDTRLAMEENGYYTTEAGQNYFLLDLYFSDRISGDIYYETHPVLLDANLDINQPALDAVEFHGIRELDADDGLSSDAAKLWAAITEGQVVLQEEETHQEHDDMMHMAAE